MENDHAITGLYKTYFVVKVEVDFTFNITKL